MIIDPQNIERLIVLGDIHGDFGAFKKGVSLRGPGDLLIFLGDYADRGPDGLEVIEGLNALLTRLPDQVIALKGNHEDYTPSGEPTFVPCTLIDEVKKKRGSWKSFFPLFSNFVPRLFLSAILPGKALFIHGGIHGDIQSLDDLANPDSRTLSSLLWSDPGTGRKSRPGPRGVGELFGTEISEAVLKELGVKHLIRGHEPRKAAYGPHIEHEGRVITTSGTSVYGGNAFALVLDVNDWPKTSEDFVRSVQYLS